MLEHDKGVRLAWPDDEELADRPEWEQQAKFILDRYLRVDSYSAPSYECLEFSKQIYTCEELEYYMDKEFTRHVSKHKVLTIDFEGISKIDAPSVLLIQCLGKGSVVIHLSEISRKLVDTGAYTKIKSFQRVQELLRPLVRAVFSGDILVFGSDIKKDVYDELKMMASHHEDIEGIGRSSDRIIDTETLFFAAKAIGLFPEEIVEFVDRTGQFNLGIIGLCCNGANYKPFGRDDMRRYLGLEKTADKKIPREANRAWGNLPSFLQYGRRTLPNGEKTFLAPIHMWLNCPLTQPQELYAHLDVATVLRLVLQYTCHLHYAHEMLGSPSSLTDAIDRAVEYTCQIMPASSLPRDFNYVRFTEEQLNKELRSVSVVPEITALCVEPGVKSNASHRVVKVVKSAPPSGSFDTVKEGQCLEVDSVIDKRVRDGKTEYLLKWKDRDASHNTWKPIGDCDCPEKIEEFELCPETDEERLVINLDTAEEADLLGEDDPEVPADKVGSATEKELVTDPEKECATGVPQKSSSKRSGKRSSHKPKSDLTVQTTTKTNPSSTTSSGVRIWAESQPPSTVQSQSQLPLPGVTHNSDQHDRSTLQAQAEAIFHLSQTKPGQVLMCDSLGSNPSNQAAFGMGSLTSATQHPKIPQTERVGSLPSATLQSETTQIEAAKVAIRQDLRSAQVLFESVNSAFFNNAPAVTLVNQLDTLLSSLQITRTAVSDLVSLEHGASGGEGASNKSSSHIAVSESFPMGEESSGDGMEVEFPEKVVYESFQPGQVIGGTAPKSKKGAAKFIIELDQGEYVHFGVNKEMRVENYYLEPPQDQLLLDDDLENILGQNFENDAELREHYRSHCGETFRNKFKDVGFKFDTMINHPHNVISRQRDWKNMDQGKCRHRHAYPPLTTRSCSHCGKVHIDPQDCVVLRYHQGDNLFSSDRLTLEEFPCGYCFSSHHITKLCPVLHSYCKDCRVRGHRPISQAGKMMSGGRRGKCKITKETFDKYAERFAKFNHLGKHTSKATSTVHPWGFRVPEHHLCQANYWSSSENEDN